MLKELAFSVDSIITLYLEQKLRLKGRNKVGF